jgi:PKD repeat protein
MTIPSVESNYPDALDTDTNLFLVHDSLRVKLADNYNPGDTSITIYDENSIMSSFPTTGIITLTEQCSDIDERAISLYYSSKTTTSFDGLELLPGFPDVIKPKDFTNVTLNVIDRHHNAIKNAVIAIEQFVGIRGTTDTRPFGSTIEGRVNFLTKLAFTPKAWFSANQIMGLTPLSIVFTDESFQLGPGTITYTWDFGDCNASTISYISCHDISVTTSRIISHTYLTPSYYNVTLTVSNTYGESTVVFPNFINARVPAPDEAVAFFVPTTGQVVTPGIPASGPYTTIPVIRSPIDALISIELPTGTNPATGRTYGGVQIVDGQQIDPIEEYTWSLGDDLTHANQNNATALYSIGGIYDMVLRVDTEYGAYRITQYNDSIDVVEDRNIWLWEFDSGADPVGNYAPLDYLTKSGLVTTYEFGLLSETFKTGTNNLNVVRSETFLDGQNNEHQAKTEFRRNVGFTPRSTTTSGSFGSGMIYYASQGCPLPPPGSFPADHEVKITEFNGFDDTYTTETPICQPWNWINLNSNTKSYFVLGVEYNAGGTPFHNYSLQRKVTYDLLTLTPTYDILDFTSYTNGAQDLREFVSTYDPGGVPTNGYFAVYRSAWKDSAGYFLRNDGVGSYFRLKSFYKTEGTIANEFQTITKLTDITGSVKEDGQLVALSDGLFFFDNSGNISAYNTTSNVWETGGAVSTSSSFRSLQDTSVVGFESTSNTLLATTDGDRAAYLSYDYSSYAFIKFSSLELTFSNIGPRPGWNNSNKTQFLMGMY